MVKTCNRKLVSALGFAALTLLIVPFSRTADAQGTSAVSSQQAQTTAQGTQDVGAGPAQGTAGGTGTPAQDEAVNANALPEIIITATHQATAVNDTPLSITAVTTTGLLQQGIENFSDVVGAVPGVTINQALATGLANIAIRGIQQGTQGAATTGFYLDDTPLQKWNAGGNTTASTNGTPLPPIFDLDNLEVLRGPQGTLYGASSEGGTVRYVTPAPNLEEFHSYVKGEVSQTQYANDPNYDGGLALGGPIIPGTLGFRASFYQSYQNGWFTYVDPYSQQTAATDPNSTKVQEFHGAILWKPTDRFQALFSIWDSLQSTPDGGALGYDQPITQAINAPALCYNTSAITPATHNSGPTPVAVGAAACAAYPGVITYTRPAATYGPYNLQPYQIIGGTYMAQQPASSGLFIPSMTLTTTFPAFNVKLISSFVHDEDDSSTSDTTEITSNNHYDATMGNISIPEGLVWLANYPDQGIQHFVDNNDRDVLAEELRFTSTENATTMGAGHLSWTGGLYYEHDYGTDNFNNLMPAGQMNALAEALYGMSAAQRWGVGPIAWTDGYENFAIQRQTLSDTNAAVYGEANYNITDRLQATVGIRESRVSFFYWQAHYGPVSGNTSASYAADSETIGSTENNPFTPKLEFTYRFSDNTLLYALGSKGFRPGGVNEPLSANICGPAMAQYGLTVNNLPPTYGPDSLMNYELGGKTALFNNRAQVNGDIYLINWSNVQLTQSPGFGCGSTFTTNAGSAVSKGVELESQAILLKNLVGDLSFTYDKAYYSQNAIAIAGPIRDLVVALAGQNLPLSPWSLDLGARYNFSFSNNYAPYVRADWRVIGGYQISEWPLGSWAPDANWSPSVSLLNLRAGITLGAADINFYAINALNNISGFVSGGRSGCATEACTSYTTYSPLRAVSAPMPRTIGLQVVYRR